MCAANTSSSRADAGTASGGPGRAAGPLLFLGAFALYALTSSRYAVPDLSAELLVQHLHLTPFPPMHQPVWSWVARAIASVAGPSAVPALNLFSAACGAGAVWLLFALLRDLVQDPDVKSRAPGLGFVAALAAALYLATCVPFWMVSNRAHPASMSLLLLLGSLALLARFARTRRLGLLYAATVVYAVGAADAVAFLFCAPVVALYAVVLLWRLGLCTPTALLRCAACTLAFPAILLLGAAEYAALPAAQWREFQGLWDALHYYLLDYRSMIRAAVPRQGWLLLLMTSILPFFVGAMAMRKRRAWDAGPGVYVLYLVLTGVAVLVLFNGPVAPWTVIGASPLLVTPYALVAACYAFMIVRWGSVIVAYRANARRAPGPVTACLGLAALALVAVAAVRNAPAVSTRDAGDVHALAAASLDHLSGRTLVVTEGLLDHHLLLEARARGQRVRLLDVFASEQPAYARYMASLFDEPRRQGMALAGLGPLLVDWLDEGDSAAADLAISFTPDLWLSTGHEPEPMATTYLGARDRGALEPDRVSAAGTSFWDLAVPALARLTNGTPAMRRLAPVLGMRWSRIANDTGVYLENAGVLDQAETAYRRALDLNPDNLSAALNLVVLARAGGGEAAGAEALVERERGRATNRTPVAVAQAYGHLRTKDAADLVWGSGRAPSADPAWQEAIRAYLGGDRADARRRLERLVTDQPGRDDAWILLARVAYEQGDVEAVQRCLRQMRAVEREWPALLVILGRLALDRGDLQSARDYFERASVLSPGDLATLETLLWMDTREQDTRKQQSRIRRILSQQPAHGSANFALGRLLMEDGRYEAAEVALRRAAVQRRDAEVLAALAWAVQRRGGHEEALALSTEAVGLNGRLGAARVARAHALLDLDRPDEARQELDRALALDARDVSARVGLAHLLARTGERDEARRRARRLLDEEPDLTKQQAAELRALL